MATNNRTPYEILGVPENTCYGQLRAVYRTRIHEHLQKKISSIHFRRICRAYETLSDFDRRNHFDNEKEWTIDIPIDRYTPQQLAAEPDLFREFKKRLEKVSLTQINAKDPITGHTTLYCAARAGNIEAVKFLTEHGAEPDLSQRTKSTALHVASFYGHANVVRCLLENGADYRIINLANHTSEQEAYNTAVQRVFIELKRSAYVRVASNELEWFQNNELKQHQDAEYFSQRQTLLHCASKKGCFDMVRLLVEQYSANIDLVDFNGNSALHLAAYGGYTDIVEYLLNRGCDSTLTNRWGTTAEEEGARHGIVMNDLFQNMRDCDMFEMARKGKDWWFYYYFNDHRSKDMIDSEGISLLYYACRYGHYSVAKWLLEHGANIDIQMGVAPRSTPLHVAKYRGHLSIVELLLEHGADVNIKNDYGATVFDDGISDEVNEGIANKMKLFLQRFQHNLKSHKLIDVEIYLFGNKEDRPVPIQTLQIDHKTRYEDLLRVLPETLLGKKYYFSIAGRPLNFEKSDTTLMAAVYCARYGTSKFLDTPLRITLHQTALKKKDQYSTREDRKLDVREIPLTFLPENETQSIQLKYPFADKQTFNNDNLSFTFPVNCVKDDVTFGITRLRLADERNRSVPRAICFFKTNLIQPKDSTALLALPQVTIADQPNARLYTLAIPSSYWFNSGTRINQLPMIGSIHAFVQHVDIIPGHLTLPADMFIANALGRPLQHRNDPVPCMYLVIHRQDTKTFPHKAYHGTNIRAIQSILLDGLVVPGTIVGNGRRIDPPGNHVGRDVTAMGIPNFATAIFLSPSVHYSSDPSYANKFSYGDQDLIPVLECSVKKRSYTANRSTTPHYDEHPGENLKTIEWRVTNPANIQINAVLFITKTNSIANARTARTTSII